MADAAIPLQVRPPQVTPFPEAAGQILGLRNLQNQGQLQQQSIQAAQMENQQRALQLKSEEAIRQAYMDANGDYDKLPELAAKNGALPKDLLSLNQTITQMRLHHAQLDETTLKNNAAKADQLGGLFEPIITAPPEQKQQLYENAVRTGQQRGLISDPNYSTQYPGDDSVKLLVNQFKGAKQLNTEAHQAAVSKAAQERADAAMKQATTSEEERKAKLPGIQADTEEKQRQNASTKLSSATDRDDYMRKWATLDHKVAAQFPHPDTYDPDTTPDTVRKLGMTPAQAGEAEHRGVVEDYEQQRLDIERQRASRERGQTANSTAVDQRQARSAIAKLQLGEAKLNRFRGQLGTALSSLSTKGDFNGLPSTYIDRLGNTKPMQTASGNDPDVAKSLAEEMRQTYGNASDELKQTIAEKNNHYQFLGATPTVSTQDAHAKIDQGDANLFKNIEAKKNPQPAAAPPAPAVTPVAPEPVKPRVAAPNPAPKVATMADVQRFATAHKITLDDAKKAAASQGWKIQ